MDAVVAVVLGGGRGTRLYPLTKLRSKPAVPLAGKYRLVDIPISNCINSGLRQMYVLSQFQSASLNRHVARTYRFDLFSRGFVEILAAEQTEASMDWYQGTADAVRKQLHHVLSREPESILILSGDQLYTMDYRRIVDAHRASRADVTVAATPVVAAEASEFGILQIDPFGTVVDFVEKPADPALLAPLALRPESLQARGIAENRQYLASMGIYVFRPEVLVEMLEDPTQLDFGKEVIPAAIKARRVHCFFFADYWEDIGTIRNFYAANIGLTSPAPPLNLFDATAPIFTRPRLLPGAQLHAARVRESIVCEACRIDDATIERSIVGIRAVVGRGARISETVVMGADFFATAHQGGGAGHGIPLGIGEGCTIERAIIDKNACIGAGVTIRGAEGRPDADGEDHCIRDGIVVVPKHAVIAAGTVI